jgi:NADH-quinone oxidoreductase subunit K
VCFLLIAAEIKTTQAEACATWSLGKVENESRTMIPTSHYLFLSLGLFTVGVIGVVTRRNVIIILMSIELMLNAVNINLVAFSRLVGSAEGHAFAIFIITDAAAEAAVGLGIIIAFFRNRETLLGDEMDLLKW